MSLPSSPITRSLRFAYSRVKNRVKSRENRTWFKLTGFELAGFYCTTFIWEFKRGFVNVKAVVSRAVHLRVSVKRASTVYQQ